MAVVWAAPAAAPGVGRAEPLPVGTPRQGPAAAATLSARQRKQVYMHSALFETGGPPPQSVYAPARQAAVLGEVHRALATPRRECEVARPRPADLKATANSGHGVVIWSAPPAGEPGDAGGQQQEFVQLGEAAEPMRVVRASREDRIPREFRGTSSNLQWSDQRSERVCCRGKEFFSERAGLDASTRKQQDLSSEVFGKAQTVGAAQARPSFAERSPRGAERAGAKTPLSARQRQSQNLNPSGESQFSVYADSAENAAASPTLGKRNGEAALEARRRTERNFSDLFGKPASDKPAAVSSRTEFHGTSNVDFLDFHVEIASRRKERRTSPPPSGSVIYRPTDASPERACWDTRSIMQSGAEVARRCRERRQAGGAEAGSGSRDRSASERKRSELASGQLRIGTGASPEPHDTARAASATPPPRSRRLVTDSPLGRSLRNVRPGSAQARKLSSLQGSGIF